MRLKNIKVIVRNNIELTTVGIIYNVHTDLNGEFIFDDFGDKLYINRNDFTNV